MRSLDTGCGKTTVVQLMSVLLKNDLKIVNCHASTETSDLLGGLRPLRGRRKIMEKLLFEVFKISQLLGGIPAIQGIEIPEFLCDRRRHGVKEDLSDLDYSESIPSDAPNQILIFITKLEGSLSKSVSSDTNQSQCEKKRKLENGCTRKIPLDNNESVDLLSHHLNGAKELLQQYNSLFEWIDGPLVNAMKDGSLFLLDEMSLAEDAVLERLNSVLEPSRTITLAEKGGDIQDEESGKGSVIHANESFRVFATMNPGGDFGKRELSPALRSRFTEIWVPAVTDISDIDLVLEHTLFTSFTRTQVHNTQLTCIKSKMLEYINWFNNKICANPMSSCVEFSLSLRDVLAWARFIVDTNSKIIGQNIGLWAAYAHGASLMHLDGLGLGTGLTQENAAGTKKEAKMFIRAQIPHELRKQELVGFEDDLVDIVDTQLLSDKNFGVDPFVISVGPAIIPTNVGFKMSAPTTALNLRRVLRALQITKPILLEGSPGVGKTSLISALASMSGHNLVRINLSEQTDITDLMGSDLPIPTQEDSVTGASFQWCDGALLRAIKNGHWVLLDELNLASQTVLEGLNSCLDHRASVYIPELGETFRCPPTFRIFAAQNPLAQGGGRKGLPKSFLNRFTKVYVEALNKDDLRGIVKTKFPVIPPTAVEEIVNFNCTVQQDIDDRRYGQLGSPWEFNLRDVFRWCELVELNHKESGEIDFHKFADTIYLQRLRSQDDRDVLTQRYRDCFEDMSSSMKVKELHVNDDTIQVGNATIERDGDICQELDIIGNEPTRIRSCLRPMEAVAFCVQMNWPCLMVGPPASGKSSILKILSESCNRKLTEIALTPSSDVNELIGSFEQIDVAEIEKRLEKSFQHIIREASTTLVYSAQQLAFLQKLNLTNVMLHQKIVETKCLVGELNPFSGDDVLEIAEELIEIALTAAEKYNHFSKMTYQSISLAKDDIKVIRNVPASHNSNCHFRWVDGILVTALEKGYWLHLENANLCPSSVLDRINPLMESGGVLVLTECGIQDKSRIGTLRVVKPHPNFRIFLSTNPALGEVSRAMRNRCIEVSLLSPLTPTVNNMKCQGGGLFADKDAIDTLELVSDKGIISSAITKQIVHTHLSEFGQHQILHDDGESVRSLQELATLNNDALNRGFSIAHSFNMAKYISYGGKNCDYYQVCPGSEQLISSLQSRHIYSSVINEMNGYEDARLVEVMESMGKVPLGMSCIGKSISDPKDSAELFDSIASFRSYDRKKLLNLRTNFSVSFVSKSIENEAIERYHLLAGRSGRLQRALGLVLMKFATVPVKDETLRLIVLTNRLDIILSECELFEYIQLMSPDTICDKKLSVMGISFAIYENKIDRSHLHCSLTPILYPLFNAIDAFLCKLFLDEKFVEECRSKEFEHLRKILSSRDRFWVFLKNRRFSYQSSLSGFNEAGFLVHWNWFKKAMFALLDCHKSVSLYKLCNQKRKLDLIIANIDRELSINVLDSRTLSNRLWKSAGHPLMPACAHDWISIDSLRQSSMTLSVLSDKESYLNLISGVRKPIKLVDLTDCHHSCLIASSEIKKEILSALCMAHWTTTDETMLSTRQDKKNYNISKIKTLLLEKIASMKEEMSLQLHLHAVDTSVHLESNKLDLEDLEKLKDKCSGDLEGRGIDLIHKLLSTFAGIQLMQPIEFWCVKEEIWIIHSLTSVMMSCDETCALLTIRKSILQRIRNFIDIAINHLSWPISDLRPYQTFVWAIESPGATFDSLKNLFRCTYATLLVISTRHQWSNSYNDLLCISHSLSSPLFWNDENKQNSSQLINPENYGGHMGSARLHQNVMSSSIFTLVGLSGESVLSWTKYPYLTLENFAVREEQSKTLSRFLLKDLSSVDECLVPESVIEFFLENVLRSLDNCFDNADCINTLRSYIFGLGEFIWTRFISSFYNLMLTSMILSIP